MFGIGMPNKMWGEQRAFFPWRREACHVCVMNQFGNIQEVTSMLEMDFELLLNRLEADDKSW